MKNISTRNLIGLINVTCIWPDVCSLEKEKGIKGFKVLCYLQSEKI